MTFESEGEEAGSDVEARGFDPAVGFCLRYGRQSLALDVVEAFRQPVVAIAIPLDQQ